MRTISLQSVTGILVCFVVILFCQSAPAKEHWKAGVARVNITPEQPMWMAGYAHRSHPSAGKLTDLWAKVLVLEDPQQQRAVLISLDLIGIGRTFATKLCKTAEERFGFQRRQIAICSSHTHSGPVVGRNLMPLHYAQLDRQQQMEIDQYEQRLQQLLLTCVERALTTLEPCRLRWGSGTSTFAVNRRHNSEKDVARRRNENSLKGPFDHDVPVLAISSADGALRAVIFGYACHATVLDGYQWSGDYPGYAQIQLESMYPGCTAMFWAGCGADQNPLPRREVVLAKQYGESLADAVRAVLSAELEDIAGPLATDFCEIPLPLDTLPSRDQIERDRRSENRYVAARAGMLLAELDAGRSLPTTYPYAVGCWKLGNQLQFVFLGGEVVVDYALRLKSELQGTRTWVSGYANDVMAYIPSRRVLREGGYEGEGAMVYYGLPTRWSPGVEKMIVDEVHRLLAASATR